MNVWLVGGGIYVFVVLFALALVRVSASTGSETGDRTIKPSRSRAEYEALVDLDTDETQVAIQLAESSDALGSRQGPQTRRSSDRQKAPHGPRQPSIDEHRPASRSLDPA